MKTCFMPDTLTSFLHLNCTSIPHGGALCTFYRLGNSVTCSNSHRNSGSSNSTTDVHSYNMLPLRTKCYFCYPLLPFFTTPPHALRSLSINHYKGVNIKLSDTLPEFPCLGQNETVFNITYTLRQHFLAVFWFCFFLCSRKIDREGGGNMGYLF